MKSYTLTTRQAAAYDSQDQREWDSVRETLPRDAEIYHPEGFVVRGPVEDCQWEYYSTESGQCFAKKGIHVFVFAGLDGLQPGNSAMAILPYDAIPTTKDALEACAIEVPEDLQ